MDTTTTTITDTGLLRPSQTEATKSGDSTLYIIISVLAVLICILIVLFIYFWRKWSRIKANLEVESPRSPLKKIENHSAGNQRERKSIDEDNIFNKIYNKQIVQNIEAQNETNRHNNDVLLPLDETYTNRDNTFMPGTVTRNVSDLDITKQTEIGEDEEYEYVRKGSNSITDKLHLKWRKSSILQSETASMFSTKDAMQQQMSYDETVDDDEEESESSETFDTYTIQEAPMNRKE